MILTDREIQLALLKRQIFVDPNPTSEFYTSTSLDLQLDPILTIFNKEINKDAAQTYIDPSRNFKAEEVVKRFSQEITIDETVGFVLEPKVFILANTKQKVRLPEETRVAARVEGKSSLARLGLLVHFTAPTIHSGFNNTIRLEMINLGPLPIKLRAGMRICQLIFELTFGTPDKAFKALQTG